MYDFNKKNLLKRNNIKNLLNERGITQQDFAEKVNRSTRNIGNWIRNVSLPGKDSISAITECLNVRQSCLFFSSLDEINEFEHELFFNAIINFFETPPSKSMPFDDRLTYVSNLTGISATADLIDRLIQLAQYFDPEILICFTKLKIAENRYNLSNISKLNEQLKELLLNFIENIITKSDNLDGLRKLMSDKTIEELGRYKVYNLFSLSSSENLEVVALNNIRLLIFSLLNAFERGISEDQRINERKFNTELIKFCINMRSPSDDIKQHALNTIHSLNKGRELIYYIDD